MLNGTGISKDQTTLLTLFLVKHSFCNKLINLEIRSYTAIHHNFFITLVGVQASFHVSYPIRVISRVKCRGYIGEGVFNSYLGSNPDQCYIQNHVVS